VDPYPATDGIHYGPDESRSWAERVAADFRIYLKISKAYTGRIPANATRLTQPQAGIQPPGNVVEALANRNPGSAATQPQPATKPTGPPVAIDPDLLIRQASEVELTIKLLEKSEIKNLTDVPYENALGVFEYEVVDDRLGNYPLKRIRIAHGIVFNRKYTGSARRPIGAEITLRMVPLAKYPNLQRWQTVDDLRPNFELPLYTPKLD
jgi:hypothetical protein